MEPKIGNRLPSQQQQSDVHPDARKLSPTSPTRRLETTDHPEDCRIPATSCHTNSRV